MYSQGLNKELAKRIIINGAPTILSEWMIKASTLDGYVKRENQFFSNAVQNNLNNFQNKGKQPWKPRTYIPRENMYQGESPSCVK